MTPRLAGAPVLVVGAGTMGAGIAQVAAQAGHPVRVHDARAGAADAAAAAMRETWSRLAAKGRLAPDEAAACAARVTTLAALHEARDEALAIEAVVERLDAKQALLRELQALLGPQAVLASNTSSLSITALAAGLPSPGRVVGLHLFNPVPLMKLVEVVSGLHTDPAVASAVSDLARAWGAARLVTTDGRTATGRAAHDGTPDVAVVDWPVGDASARPALAWAVAEQAGADWREQAPRWLHAAGFRPCETADTPALVVARTLSMLVNEAADAVLHGVCGEADADTALRLGANHPAGPFEWLGRLGAGRVVTVIDHLDAHCRGERDRASAALRRRAWATDAARNPP